MFVDFRPTSRLRGAKAIDAAAAIGPVFEALCEDSVDLAHLRMVCDWIQYRANFRDVVDLREILPPSYPGIEGATVEPARADELEIAIDLRRSADESQRSALKATTRALLAAHRGEPSPPVDDRLVLEAWRPGSQSCIWEFNRLYWQALDLWEKATGQLLRVGAARRRERRPQRRGGARAHPRPVQLVGPAGRAQGAARGALRPRARRRQRQPGQDLARRVPRRRGGARAREYYRRLHYLMCDYSPHVLEMARADGRRTTPTHVSSFVLDATQADDGARLPASYKAFLVYISNVYDNLPTDEIARIGGRSYLVETRAYLPGPTAAALSEHVGAERGGAAGHRREAAAAGPGPAGRRHGGPLRRPPTTRSTSGAGVWEGIRLEERYVPLAGLDLYPIAPGVSGELLRPILESGGDIRMHVSNGAVASFVDTLPLLHPYGRLLNHDLFVTDADQYRTGFLGPGKYDGSVVNWINGPLLALVGSRKGFDVRFEPFRHREGHQHRDHDRAGAGLMAPAERPGAGAARLVRAARRCRRRSSARTPCPSGWSG